MKFHPSHTLSRRLLGAAALALRSKVPGHVSQSLASPWPACVLARRRCGMPWRRVSRPGPPSLPSLTSCSRNCCKRRFGWLLEHTEAQSTCLFDHDGAPAVDFLGRVEHLDEDMQARRCARCTVHAAHAVLCCADVLVALLDPC